MLPNELLPHQIFVFGSNATGFHGAGAAGYACRGEAKNNWRQDKWFLKAMKSSKGADARQGKWAVFGVPRGLQKGREGWSYAIQTIVKPGQKRSLPLFDIQEQIRELVILARSNPMLEFLVTPVGEGYAGYTKEEMDKIWWCYSPLPSNMVFIGRENGVAST